MSSKAGLSPQKKSKNNSLSPNKLQKGLNSKNDQKETLDLSFQSKGSIYKKLNKAASKNNISVISKDSSQKFLTRGTIKNSKRKSKKTRNFNSLLDENANAREIERMTRERQLLDRMNKNLPILYIPKRAMKKSPVDLSVFKSFDNIEGSEKFSEKMNKIYPVTSFEGIKGRLRHNSTTKKNYSKFSKSIQKESMRNIMMLIKNDKKKNNKIFSKKKKNLKKKTKIFKENFTGKSAKDKFSHQERIRSIKVFTFMWKSTGHKMPLEAREGCSFTKEGSYGWIIGGMNENIISTVARFNFREYEVEFFEVPQETNMPRFNHTAEFINEKIFIFGGETMKDDNFSSRHCLNDVKIFDPKIKIFENSASGGNFFIARRSHVSIKFGKYVLINGGLDTRDQILEDTWLYNSGNYFK